MWKSPLETSKKLTDSLFLFFHLYCDHNLYGMWMHKVVECWTYACEHNLTDLSINRKAWIGHAACCMAIKCPEEVTRMAWHFLTHEQQFKANNKAREVIKRWERRHFKKKAKESCQRLIWV